MKYSHIVWDFNGTILDDLYPCIDVLNIILRKRKLPDVNKECYLEVFGFPIKSYYETVGLDFSKEDYGELADEWSVLYKEVSADCGMCKGVVEALEYFAASGLPQYILSATEYDMLTEQVKELGIENYFEELLALRDFHAASKVRLGKDWVAKTKPEKVLFIGDTIHDYETASAMYADCVLIAAGHQSKKRLSACGVPIFDSLDDFLIHFKNNNM